MSCLHRHNPGQILLDSRLLQDFRYMETEMLPLLQGIFMSQMEIPSKKANEFPNPLTLLNFLSGTPHPGLLSSLPRTGPIRHIWGEKSSIIRKCNSCSSRFPCKGVASITYSLCGPWRQPFRLEAAPSAPWDDLGICISTSSWDDSEAEFPGPQFENHCPDGSAALKPLSIFPGAPCSLL